MNKILFVVISLCFSIFQSCYEKAPKFIGKYPVELYLPDDLEVSLWAESPMLYNPTNLDTDIKGRIWVTEGVNYRKFNNDSTFYKDTLGDRIMILEDIDQDGIADTSKVFVQDKDLVAPLGIAVLGNQVIVSCSPYLIRYTDTNGDDKPDNKEILLKGFGGLDHDHSLHSVVFGPDGKYYFNVGNAGPHMVSDKSGWTLRSGTVYTGGSPHNEVNSGNRVSDDGRLWVGGLQMRLEEDGTGLKVLAHNFRNSYETYVDGIGDMWQNDNDDQVVACRVSWVAPGGNAGFFSNDGTRQWNADQRPGQDMPTAHWHMDDPGIMPTGDITGAGSPTGMVRLETDHLGKDFLGSVLSADAGRNALFSYQPSITGSGFDLKGKRNIFLTSSAVDDIGYQWNNTHFENDKSKWFRPSDMVVGTDGALYVADWYDAVVGGHQIKDSESHGRIYRITPKNKKLSYPRYDLSTSKGQIEVLSGPAVNVKYLAYHELLKGGEKSISGLAKLLEHSNPFLRARALFLLAKLGQKGEALVFDKLNEGEELDQLAALRALQSVTTGDQMIILADKAMLSKHPIVRREAVVKLDTYSFEKKIEILRKYHLANMGEDSYYYNALLFASFADEEKIYQDLKLITPELEQLKLATLFRTPSSLDLINAVVNNNEERIENRISAVNAMSFINTPDAVKSMLKLKEDKSDTINKVASYWLAFRSGNDWSELYDWSKINFDIKGQQNLVEMLALKERILNTNISVSDRRWNAETMASNPVGGKLLVDMMKNNQLPNDVIENTIKGLSKNSDQSLILIANSMQSSSEKISYNEGKVLAMKGDKNKGKAVYESSCVTCHRHGSLGKDIGPEMTNISNKLDAVGLYEAITKPSSSIVFGYESWVVRVKSGDVMTGFIVSDNGKMLTIKDLAGNKKSITYDQIKSKKKDTKSIMPSASSYQLSDQQLSDLIAWLGSN